MDLSKCHKSSAGIVQLLNNHTHTCSQSYSLELVSLIEHLKYEQFWLEILLGFFSSGSWRPADNGRLF